jgi:hypothetical protein
MSCESIQVFFDRGKSPFVIYSVFFSHATEAGLYERLAAPDRLLESDSVHFISFAFVRGHVDPLSFAAR